jgi:hypothetical protein
MGTEEEEWLSRFSLKGGHDTYRFEGWGSTLWAQTPTSSNGGIKLLAKRFRIEERYL